MKKGKWIIGLLILNLVLFAEANYTQEAARIKPQMNEEAEKYIEMCKSSLEQEKPDEAVEFAEKAVAINDSCSRYHYWLGQAYGLKAQKAALFGKFSNAKKCKNAWLKAVELDPENLQARMGLFNYYFHAPGIAGGGKDKAKKEAEEIIKINPERGYLVLAQVYESEEKYTEAEHAYIEATEVDPENIQPYFNLGYFYQKREKFDKAGETFQKIFKIEPDNLGVYYQLGRNVIFSGKDLEKGITYFKKYLEKEPSGNNPSWSYAHWRLGILYEKLDSKDQAITEYKKALELDPENKEAKEALGKIDD